MTDKDLAFLESRKHDGSIFDLLNPEEINLIPTTPGAYILISHGTKFIYPEGQSKVIYIGKGNNLRKRLLDHHKGAHGLKSIPKKERKDYTYYSRYHYILKFGCEVIWISRRGTEKAKDLESKLIFSFYSKYQSLPVGNASFSFKESK
jgi:excinuclease UvrABC nuclease subunit